MTTASLYAQPMEPSNPRFSRGHIATYALTPNLISLVRDVAFAITTASIIWDVRSPVGHVPIFLVFAILTFFLNLSSLTAWSKSLRVFVPPLFIFGSIHLISAFLTSSPWHTNRANGFKFLFQFCAITAFLWPLVVRYSQVSMRRYLALTGSLFFMTLLFILAYHAAHHRYVSWKLLSRGKSIFDLMPIMLIVLSRSKRWLSRLVYPLLLPIFLIIILISGERKAYILIVLIVPFLINFRNPMVYIGPLFGGVLFSIAKVLQGKQGHGYIERQVNTLMGFAHGSVVRTNSNTERLFAVNLASKMFRRHPVFGSGTNSYNLLVERVYLSTLGTHNEWYRVLAENGVFGMFFYLATVLYGFAGLFRTQVWGYTRSKEDKLFGYALFMTCFMYLSFEAYDYEVLIAFCTIPLIQFMRFSPSERRLPQVARRRDNPLQIANSKLSTRLPRLGAFKGAERRPREA